jgi:hypothetical protein
VVVVVVMVVVLVVDRRRRRSDSWLDIKFSKKKNNEITKTIGFISYFMLFTSKML